MCGIVAYIGTRNAFPILLNGIKRLEYRGYDSTGIVTNDNEGFKFEKSKGKVVNLEDKLKNFSSEATIGLAHTRWATHGEPNDVNAHPHFSNSGKLVIIHNGIIENYESIKKFLLEQGYHFISDTDTEVLINLIEFFKERNNLTLTESVRYALNEVKGAYAICVMEQQNLDEIVVAKLGSPLSLGIGKDEYFVASDASPFIEFTKDAIYLEDGEMASITRGQEAKILKIEDNTVVVPEIQKLQFDLAQIEKGGYEHFMLKEIFEQPKSIRDTLRGRLLTDKGIIKMAGIWDYKEKFYNAKRIIIVACGTSWHAGLVGKYLIEEFARIQVEVEYASEFRYRNPIIKKDDIVVAISQSGETADTLAALKLAKEKGAFIYGICNVVGSSIARITDAGSYTHAGSEIGVASTKAFTSQLTVLMLMALKLGKHNGNLSSQRFNQLCLELDNMPNLVEKALETNDLIENISKIFENVNNSLYLGRNYNFPTALEGALKLKEISYIHAEGYPAAEMKHGPIALVDENMPVIVISLKRGHYDKIVSNIQEIKSRKGKIIAIVSEGDIRVKGLVDYVIEVPDCSEEFSPILASIPLQLLSYYIAVLRGCNVDQPRNLAKSVTVE